MDCPASGALRRRDAPDARHGNVSAVSLRLYISGRRMVSRSDRSVVSFVGMVLAFTNAKYGHSIYWGEEDNEEVDFGCDRLREIAEEQAALLARAS